MFGQRRIPRHMLLDEPGPGSGLWRRMGLMMLIACLAFAAGLAVAESASPWQSQCVSGHPRP